MKGWIGSFALILFLSLSPLAMGQNLEVNGGWVHATGDFGVDGFEIGGAYWVTSRVALAGNYDSAWDTSRVGSFELTSVGLITVKSHLQNFMVGPRIFFAKKKIKKYAFSPFAEVQLGGSHLNTKIEQVSAGEQSASDSSFSWLLGGGADYVFSQHWAARLNLDLLRTHFADAGQSRLRFVLGIAYTFGDR
jgi:hypothetical protein